MSKEITKYDDVIDSRDVIERIAELESEREDIENENEQKEWDESDEGQELASLKSLESECEGYSEDWKYGAQLIRDSYFKDYAMELAEDIGAINNNATWPNNCIDWDQAAKELQMDYTGVTLTCGI